MLIDDRDRRAASLIGAIRPILPSTRGSDQIGIYYSKIRRTSEHLRSGPFNTLAKGRLAVNPLDMYANVVESVKKFSCMFVMFTGK